ncbi:MAG: DUF4397 domain-containing protein [Gammaproteobacteria bacterium]|jgi:hypothetical protein|nr:DUF4397 domain-containing protein [Gammaproteobacteria bacterium]
MLRKNLILTSLASLAVALVTTACNNSSSGPGLPDSLIRVVHAVSDAPRVNVFLNDDLVLEDFDFRHSSGFVGIRPGTYDVRVEAIIPGADDLPVIVADDVTFLSQEKTTIYATGTTSPLAIAPLLVPTPIDDVMPGMARVGVVHASPAAQAIVSTVTVFATSPGLDISTAAPLGSFAFGETLGPVQVPAGDYQIRIAAGSGPDFTNADVVFDAGTVSLADGADLQIAAVDSTVTGASPVSLVVSDDAGGSDVFDIATGADVRVVHNSPDAPAVDVVVNDDFAAPVLSGVTFTQFSDFLSPPIPPGTYNFKVVDTATQTVEALNFDADLAAGTAYTVIANDLLANITEVVLIDDNRRVATEAKLRIVHGSPAAGPVDIYLLQPGVLPSDTGAVARFEGVELGRETGFVSVAPGTYDIYVTPAGSPGVLAIPATGTPVAANGIYTAIARDAVGGGAPLGLILLDDFD